MKRIGIIGGGLAPFFNEAMANQINLLSKQLNLPVVTCNDVGSRLLMKSDQYIIFNSKFIIRRSPFLSLINGGVIFLAIKYYEQIFDWIILSGGIESEFLEYLDSRKCIPLVPSVCQLDDIFRKKIQKYLPNFPFIIAQSKKTKNQLIELGANPERIFLMYPLVDLTRYRYSDPPYLNDFTIVFASSPNMNVPGEDNFSDKGVPLLLEAFKEFLKFEPKSKLCLVWRGYYNRELEEKINKLGLEDSVEVLYGLVDMPVIYSRSHITVIPYLNLKRSPDIPLSALESLACGRPVVATEVGEIAEFVASKQVGISSKTDFEDLCRALKECRQNYIKLQENCKNLDLHADIPLQLIMERNINE
jgi:glycosyltransferase involved in cell wall biosynthesis